jgi:hypothetical protein
MRSRTVAIIAMVAGLLPASCAEARPIDRQVETTTTTIIHYGPEHVTLAMETAVDGDELRALMDETRMNEADATAVLRIIRYRSAVAGMAGAVYYPEPGYEPGNVGIMYTIPTPGISCGPGSEADPTPCPTN